MNCPPDFLCKWLPEQDRWETWEELAIVLQEEAASYPGARRRYAERTGTMLRSTRRTLEEDRQVKRMMQIVGRSNSRFVA